MTQDLVSLIAQYGLLIVGANVLVDQIGLPVPAYPTLVVAGAIAADGHSAAGPLYLLCVIACLLADCGRYLVGQIYGIKVLKLLCRISLEPDSCVSQTQSRFERWGINSLVIAKFVPGLAIIAPPLAGAMRIGWRKFIVLSTLSAAIWVGSGIAAGMLFRSQIDQLLLHLDRFGAFAGIIIAGLLAGYIAFKWWERARFYSCCAWHASASPNFTISFEQAPNPSSSMCARIRRNQSSRGRYRAQDISLFKKWAGISPICRAIGTLCSIAPARTRRPRPGSPRFS